MQVPWSERFFNKGPVNENGLWPADLHIFPCISVFLGSRFVGARFLGLRFLGLRLLGARKQQKQKRETPSGRGCGRRG